VSEIFDKLVDGAGQIISEVDKGGKIQVAISGLRHQMAEADRKRKINQIKQEILDLQTKEAQAINSLSAQVLALYEAGSLTQPELLSLCKGVDESRTQIKEKEEELAQFEPAQPDPVQAQPQSAVGEDRCPQCSVVIVAGAAFCQTCGAPLTKEEPPPPVLFCVGCGSQLREGARFCPKCGQTVPQNQQESGAL